MKNGMMMSLLTWGRRTTKPLPVLLKGCVPRNFTQVEFFVSQNFPKRSSNQFFHLMRRKNYFFLKHMTYAVTPSTYFCRPSQVLHLFRTRCKMFPRFFYVHTGRQKLT
jgi:hypothetical protein